ncbi:myosin regulatory light polypeptide 9-like, partial [Brachionus plicatilis]
EFKEAFFMIDQDRDGFITKEDLQDIFASLGKPECDQMIESMLGEASGPINFTMFLTLFGMKMNVTDSEEVIKNALSCFDEKGAGFIPEENFRQAMTTMADRFSSEEIDELMHCIPVQGGMIDYTALSRMIKQGKKES